MLEEQFIQKCKDKFGDTEAFEKQKLDDLDKYNLCKANGFTVYYIKYDQEENDYNIIFNVIKSQMV